ncbi:energy transducer TonB [Mangrovimonas aestuarii]|uniref:gliding motility protein RemB n=1 Tax=Mangrovimonas aestuarii TaxID=3018443 RepID=UPI002379238E|nr:gliding motility protein RemB [Mangrovimonas aestuarii]
MRYLYIFLFICVQWSVDAQEKLLPEKPPVFPGCDSLAVIDLESCFNKSLFARIKADFQVPEDLVNSNYQGDVVVLFEINAKGGFQVIYVDAMYESLKSETQRFFRDLPKVEPASYNGKPTFKQYTIAIPIPLDGSGRNIIDAKARGVVQLEQEAKQEYDKVSEGKVPFEDKALTSQLNIPFVHSYYARFERSMNLVGTNSHTASKPYMYEDVSVYQDLKADQEALKQDRSTWFGRKLWNEHFVQLQGKDYWFTVDLIFDFEVGKDFDADFNSTFNNTRGLYFQGGLGKKFNFFTSVYESQGRFAQYFNQYAESLKAFGPDPAIIPGRGIGKGFKDDAYDYPVAEAYLSYTPADFINVQFGHGKNFIGDGYRSLFLSDAASPHTYLKLNTKFWKIKYTSTWMWLRDVRPEVVVEDAFLTKYMANHYLSLNVSKRLNVGLFESVMWTDVNGRGFDINYVNPIILFRALEFESGQGAGNAILGLSIKYKLSDNVYAYGQFVLDEFSLSDVKAAEKSWKNKWGYQFGLKYFNALNVDNLMLQLEYNQVRPYTYSHNTIVLNYGHANQSMAHLWGSNFREFILIGRYNYQRWYADAKIIIGTKGFDYNTEEDNFSYGGDIYRNYNERPYDNNVKIGQGIKTNIFNGELQFGYLVNPATNLKLFASTIVRNFDPNAQTMDVYQNNTFWFNLGLRTDLFNWYFDF